MLDEDEWTEQMEAIIERDFFPDKAKLENKLEWLQVRDLQPPVAWQSTFVRQSSRLEILFQTKQNWDTS